MKEGEPPGSDGDALVAGEVHVQGASEVVVLGAVGCRGTHGDTSLFLVLSYDTYVQYARIIFLQAGNASMAGVKFSQEALGPPGKSHFYCFWIMHTPILTNISLIPGSLARGVNQGRRGTSR